MRARTCVGHPPTARQAEALGFIASHTAEHGYPPTLREVCTATGIRSSNGSHDHVNALVRKGMVTRAANIARGLVLTALGRAFVEGTTLAETAGGT